MTALQVFDFKNHPVRAFGTPVDPWFSNIQTQDKQSANYSSPTKRGWRIR